MNENTVTGAAGTEPIRQQLPNLRAAFEATQNPDDLAISFTFEFAGQYANPAVENRWQGFLLHATMGAAPARQAEPLTAEVAAILADDTRTDVPPL